MHAQAEASRQYVSDKKSSFHINFLLPKNPKLSWPWEAERVQEKDICFHF